MLEPKSLRKNAPFEDIYFGCASDSAKVPATNEKTKKHSAGHVAEDVISMPSV
jgi:hypothetical protein